jgi:hypothetical protein
MKKKSLYLLFSFMLFTMIAVIYISCKKDVKSEVHQCSQGQHWDEAQEKCVNDSPPPHDTTTNQLNENTILIDTTAVLGVTENTVTLSSSSLTEKPKVGSILLSIRSCSLAEYGFLRRVTKIVESGDQITCTTELCGLNDAFKELHFEDTYTNNSSTIDSAVAAPSNKPGLINSVNVSNSVQSTSTFKLTNLTVANGLTVSGTFTVNITAVRKKYDKGSNLILPQEALLEVDFNTEGSSIEITNAKNFEIKVDKRLLLSKGLGIIILPIPAPILVPPYVIILDVPFQQKLSLYTMPIYHWR